ncbi:MAG TPA: FAD-dependent oxidoreductase [Dongiaceae bacterium]|nr:FAD-dependent oxidoreductase [Dongiaceae bacterium]
MRQRLAHGGAIDRDKPLRFTFDDTAYEGFAGDTIASALLANGVGIVGRSFKYHRPRGIYTAGPEEPNAILDLRHGARHDPNARATLEPLADGMALRSIHASGTAENDRLAFVDRLARFIPSAFYYKTFMWPSWTAYEHRIRALAGLGRVDPATRMDSAAHRYAEAEVCVVGAGPSGLATALAAARQGQRVLLVEEQRELGGSLRHRTTVIDGVSGAEWVARYEIALQAAGVQTLRRSTALGLYDHNVLTVVQKDVPTSPNGERIWLVRANRIIVATGAIERPLLFANNDRPGVMLADAALVYLRRYAVKLGERVVVATNNDSAYEIAIALRHAGSDVQLVDSRGNADPALSAEARSAGVAMSTGTMVEAVVGSRVVEAVMLSNGQRVAADVVAHSGGWTPSVHLYCHAKGRPQWDDAVGSYRPGAAVAGVDVVGAAAGLWDLDTILRHAAEAGGGSSEAAPRSDSKVRQWTAPTPLPATGPGKRVWVDLQNDVTADDIGLAVRENFSAVEHLKRYTTVGMGTDQGKTSNVNALAVLAAGTSRKIADLGTTTFRPPIVPVSMATIAGSERGELQAPIRRLPAENTHRGERAYFRDYGGVLRPAWYGADADAIAAECIAARTNAVVFDASSLGKIDVIGPQAAALLNFVYYTPMSSLAVGRARYGLTLSEAGIVADDGVVLRLGPAHFVVSCSSSHVASMAAALEAWRQDRFDLAQVFVHDATAHWATIAISGPKAKGIVSGLGLGVALDDAKFPHMSVRDASFGGRPARVARVSFTGERGYEISIPAQLGGQLWQRAREAGAIPLGIEALGALRAEKGYLYVGQDTDGETMPHDLGFVGPRTKRQDAYVGDRSLFTPAANKPDRKRLVGILVEGEASIPIGAHAIEHIAGRKRSLGYVTSSYQSAHLGHPIALGLIEGGMERGTVEIEHLGQSYRARLVSPCFLDPKGERLNA